MRTKNRIDIIGFVGRDPEKRTTTSGQAVTQLSIATSERWKDKEGQPKEHTEWHRVVFFGKPAEQLAEMVRKGSLIEVEGKVRSRSYEKDGVKRSVHEIRGDEFRLLERQPTSDGGVGPFGVGQPPADDAPPADSDGPL
jgi:single-strand DNA-binding protein